MKKEVSDYLDEWLKDQIRDILYQMYKSHDLNEMLSKKFGVVTQDVFDYWDSDQLKSIWTVIESENKIQI